jgi:hypothetical protein
LKSSTPLWNPWCNVYHKKRKEKKEKNTQIKSYNLPCLGSLTSLSQGGCLELNFMHHKCLLPKEINLDATTINDVIDMPIQPPQITSPLSLKILPLLKTFLDLL